MNNRVGWIARDCNKATVGSLRFNHDGTIVVTYKNKTTDYRSMSGIDLACKRFLNDFDDVVTNLNEKVVLNNTGHIVVYGVSAVRQISINVKL